MSGGDVPEQRLWEWRSVLGLDMSVCPSPTCFFGFVWDPISPAHVIVLLVEALRDQDLEVWKSVLLS